MSTNMSQEFVDIVVLDGTLPTQEKYPRECLTKALGWEECPIPTMLGIPLLAKFIRPSQSPAQPVNLMAEPVRGIPPAKFQLVPRPAQLGCVAFGRKDFEQFTIQQWENLNGFIINLQRSWYQKGQVKSKEEIDSKINSQSFTTFIQQNQLISEMYDPVFICSALQCSLTAGKRCAKCHCTYYCSSKCQVIYFFNVFKKLTLF